MAWRLRMSWKDFFKRLYQHYSNHAVADSAAALTYYFVFSLFPFLFFLTTLAAYIPHVGSSINTLLDRARGILPPEALGIVQGQLHSLLGTPRPHFLTVALIVALYSASRGLDAVRKGLNLAYDVKETRSAWETELLAYGMTIGASILVLVGITMLVAGSGGGLWLARHVSIGDEYVTVLSWIRWPITAAAIMFVAALSYYLLPDVKQSFRFITPGSVVGTSVWFLASWGFSVYVSHFGSYNVTYGSIGGVIVLMTWLYITGFILLMGGEINAIMEHAAPDGKAPGAHAPGQAPPRPEERPSAVPPGAAKSAGAAERARGGEFSHEPHPPSGVRSG
jgi:membrane protein